MKQQANLVKALGGESLSSTVHSISINKGSWDTKEEQSEDKPSSMMLPYVAGVSERITMACPIHRLSRFSLQNSRGTQKRGLASVLMYTENSNMEAGYTMFSHQWTTRDSY